MNEYFRQRVNALRNRNAFDPLPIVPVVKMIRAEAFEPAPQVAFLADLGTEAEGMIGPLTVHVRIVPDEYSRLGEDDVTGTFTDTPSATTIANTVRNWGSDTKFYEPAAYRSAVTVAQYQRRGMSKAVALDAMRRDVELDMIDDAEREYFGVIVEVSIDGEEIAQTSLWGIDTIARLDGRGYFIETATQLIEEALGMAKQWAMDGKGVESAAAHLAAITEAAAYLTTL